MFFLVTCLNIDFKVFIMFFKTFVGTATHCVKSYQFLTFFGPYFPAFDIHTEINFVNLPIHSECGKITTRKLQIWTLNFMKWLPVWNYWAWTKTIGFFGLNLYEIIIVIFSRAYMYFIYLSVYLCYTNQNLSIMFCITTLFTFWNSVDDPIIRIDDTVIIILLYGYFKVLHNSWFLLFILFNNTHT